MLNQNIPQRQFRLSSLSQKRQRLEHQESQQEIREAIRFSSASAFVVSRLEWRLANGLNTSREVL
jgi:hypothetical protein